MIKALLFDMDNTLIYTDKANFLAYQKALKDFGFQISEQEFKQYKGRHSSYFLPILTKSKDLRLHKQISERKKQVYKDFKDQAYLIDHVYQLLKNTCKKYKTALVTTASLEATEMWLAHFKLKPFFDLIITGDNVNNKKPDPECYITTAKILNLKAEECLVLEDTKVGFKTAENAGMPYLDVSIPSEP